MLNCHRRLLKNLTLLFIFAIIPAWLFFYWNGPWREILKKPIPQAVPTQTLDIYIPENKWLSAEQIALEREAIKTKQRLKIVHSTPSEQPLSISETPESLKKYIVNNAQDLKIFLEFDDKKNHLYTIKYNIHSNIGYNELGSQLAEVGHSETMLNGSWTEHYGFVEFETSSDRKARIKFEWVRDLPTDNHQITVEVLELYND